LDRQFHKDNGNDNGSSKQTNQRKKGNSSYTEKENGASQCKDSTEGSDCKDCKD
jgi:hypothetical protein